MERGISKVFAVFVNNLPLKADSRWIAKVFNRFGKVVDVFVPKKRSRWGRKIGFVRFGSLVEARRAIWNLNGVFFLDYKIGVNLARFNPRNTYWRKVEVHNDSASKTAHNIVLGNRNIEKDDQQKSYM
ncbi:hypothetical protein REPUB_Repub16aG0114000 [Reevesia pubescens]